MKIAVIGGGGVRSMFLAKSLSQSAKRLNISEVSFMDNDEEKLLIFGKMAKKVSFMNSPELRFTLTSSAIEAVRDADYVITTIRVGGDDMRAQDERIALNHGVLGQETTGAAGMSFAMRSIPALKEYCDIIKKYSKRDVKVFNFTNPAGLVSQALRDMGYDFTYGICDAPSGMLRSFAKLYGVSPKDVKGEVYGLNHLSYFNSVKVRGQEVLDEIIENDDAYKKTDMRYFEKSLLEDRHSILNEYLYYFYYSEEALKNILNAEKTRGEQIRDINKEMIKELKKIDIENNFDEALNIFSKWYGIRENSYMASETGERRQDKWQFDPLSFEEGGYADVALKYIEIKNSSKNDSMILCVPNDGAINGLRADDVVEITCDVTKNGAIPHDMGDVDEQNLELIRRVKNYERLASFAIINRDRKIAIEALTLHPLVNSYSLAKKLVDEYITLNRGFSDGWK